MEEKIKGSMDWQTWAKRIVSVVIIAAVFASAGYAYGQMTKSRAVGEKNAKITIMGTVSSVGSNDIGIKTIAPTTSNSYNEGGVLSVAKTGKSKVMTGPAMSPKEGKWSDIRKGASVTVVAVITEGGSIEIEEVIVLASPGGPTHSEDAPGHIKPESDH